MNRLIKRNDDDEPKGSRRTSNVDRREPTANVRACMCACMRACVRTSFEHRSNVGRSVETLIETRETRQPRGESIRGGGWGRRGEKGKEKAGGGGGGYDRPKPDVNLFIDPVRSSSSLRPVVAPL